MEGAHIETVLYRPVASRASFNAMPIAAEPLGANSTLPSGRARAPELFARATAGSLVKRRGQKGSVSSCALTASTTWGWA